MAKVKTLVILYLSMFKVKNLNQKRICGCNQTRCRTEIDFGSAIKFVLGSERDLDKEPV